MEVISSLFASRSRGGERGAGEAAPAGPGPGWGRAQAPTCWLAPSPGLPLPPGSEKETRLCLQFPPETSSKEQDN